MPDEIAELRDTCEKIAHDIRNRYTIGYVPNNRNFTGAVRRIKVTASAADHGRLKVRTRTHYVAGGQDGTSSPQAQVKTLGPPSVVLRNALGSLAVI